MKSIKEKKMGLKVRCGGIALLIFLALFFDPMDGEFKWDVVSGVCEEVYNYSGNENDEIFSPIEDVQGCLLYTSPSPRDRQKSRMPSSA